MNKYLSSNRIIYLRDSGFNVSEIAKGKQTGDTYQNAHIERLGASAKWKIIEGNHYLYHGHVGDIYSTTNDFLNKI